MPGDDWNQQKISLLEQKEQIEDPLLEEIAAQLKVPADAIKKFDEDMAVSNIQNNFEGSNKGGNSVYSINTENHNCTFNPLEKYVEAVEANKEPLPWFVSHEPHFTFTKTFFRTSQIVPKIYVN